MGGPRIALSLVLALLVNAVVTLGVAVAAAAVDVSHSDDGPVDLAVSSIQGTAGFRPDDLVAISGQLNGEALISPVASRVEPLSLNGAQSTATVEGVLPNFARLTTWHLREGSFFTTQDEAALNAVAVVSQNVASNATVGDTIRIEDKPFTIVGVGSDSWPGKTVLVPLRTAQIRLFGPTALDAIYLQVASAAEASTVRHQVDSLLRTRHNLLAGQTDDFTVANVQLGEPTQPALSETRVLHVIEQFACSAKSSCVSRAVN